MDAGQIPAFDKAEDSPLLVLSDDGVVDQTKGTRGVLVYFTISAKTPIDIYNRIRACMKILHDEGEKSDVKGHFIGVIRDSLRSKGDCYNLIGLGYMTDEVAFEGMTEAECTELSLPVNIVI
jgi:hypothetical protein